MSSSLFRVSEHQVPCQHIREYAAATANEQEDTLFLALKQYTPWTNLSPKTGDVTIIGAHANGFPKELYEPIWDELLKSSEAQEFQIRNIWVADVAHQGGSGVLNEHHLGNDPSWFDHPRDLLHMINVFRDQMPRPLVGIGHSMGGCQLVQLSLIHPRMLSSLVLLDPVIQKDPSGGDGEPSPVQASTFRRDLWPSFEEAEATFRRSRFYQRWDPRVLQLWLQHGLRRIPTVVHPKSSSYSPEAVTLTTTKHQEVWTFARPSFFHEMSQANQSFDREKCADFDPTVSGRPGFYRAEPNITLLQLPHLRPSVLYMFGEQSIMSLPALQDEKMRVTGVGVGGSGGAAEGRVKKIVLAGVGHLFPLEAVGDTASHAASWLGEELKRVAVAEESFRATWSKKSVLEKSTVSDEWKRMFGGYLRGPPTGHTKL
ncbi:MAG: hypothetical protein M1817_001886 [Caeruleum heppii]|nr:MAG: hypothetical protein M1817_001886 [Caeruleum heppii]